MGKGLFSSKVLEFLVKGSGVKWLKLYSVFAFFPHIMKFDLKWMIFNNFATVLQQGKELPWKQHLPLRSYSQNNAKSLGLWPQEL